MAYLLSNLLKITGIKQLVLKLSLVVGWHTFLGTQRMSMSMLHCQLQKYTYGP